MGTLSFLEPQPLWKNFETLCQIPHPSKYEKHLVEYIKTFANKLQLEWKNDKTGNLVVRKSASQGMENYKRVVLQAHLDMVPQKKSDTIHDFTKDPIKPYIDGEWLSAEGTTLGADNGIGVAAIMTILQTKKLHHPPIEALFTVEEETGLTGAMALQNDFVSGDIFINLDSGCDGELCISCSGGIDCTATFNYQEECLSNGFQPFKITIKGLKGGHSGEDIKLGRGNSNKIMNRILWCLNKKFDMRLAKLHGGNLRNTIPIKSVAEIAVPLEKKDAAISTIKQTQLDIENELLSIEPDFSIQVEETELAKSYVDTNTTNRFLRSVYACPNGIIRMMDSMPNSPETSINLAVVVAEHGEIKVNCLLRSSVESAKQDLVKSVESIFQLAGASIEKSKDYPGWKPNPASEILAIMREVYFQKYKHFPSIKAVHAGLECGPLSKIYPHCDMISFGPTICFPHSPNEKVHIGSVGKFWEYLTSVLENIPETVETRVKKESFNF